MKQYLEVLTNKNFFLFWLGQGVSDLGSSISYIGLTWLIIKITGKTSAVSLLFILLTLPSILVGPWAGVFVDRWKKKTIIVLADIIRAFEISSAFFINGVSFILLRTIRYFNVPLWLRFASRNICSR